MKKLFLLAIIFAFFLQHTSRVDAYTTIDTDITVNTTWTLDQSPYVVISPINISSEAVLTINPGVVIKFDYGSSFYINGKLDVMGTQTESVYFTSNYDDDVGGSTDDEEFCFENEDGTGEECESFDWGDPMSGDWGGLIFDKSSDSKIKNAFIRYADTAAVFMSSEVDFENLDLNYSVIGFIGFGGSHVKLTGSKFSNLEEDGAVFFDNSSFSITDTQISGGSSWSMVSIFQNSNANFDTVNFTGSELSNVGITVFDNSRVTLKDTSISNVNDGLWVYNTSTSSVTNFSLSCRNNGMSVYNNSTLDFYKGTVSCNDYGMLIYNESGANIDGVKVSKAKEGGILVFDNVVSNPSAVANSNISENGYGFFAFNAGISAHQNKISDNETNGVFVFNPLVPNKFDFTNNYWGDASGPSHPSNAQGLGDTVSDNVLFTPWMTTDPLITCCSNVLFLPGLEASRLYVDEDGSENQLWEPNRPLDVRKLFLNEDGTSINSDIYTRDIIKETNTPFYMGFVGQNIYKSFSNTMDDLVQDQKIKEWKYYAYDWRQSVKDIVDNGTTHQSGKISLVETLQSLVANSNSGKVTIISHSNGGLLAKALLVKLQEMKTAGTSDLLDKVDVLILVASPQIGTAGAVPAILNGYDQAKLGGLLLATEDARELGRNMPSAYGLLPSREYINRVSASPVAFVDNPIATGVTTDFVNKYGTIIDSYAEYKDFLFGAEGRAQPAKTDTLLPIKLSQTLYDEAENLHNKIDAWTPPASLRVIEVAGWGLDTVASFQYYPKFVCTSPGQGTGTCRYVLDEKPIFTVDGDKTVVEPSAGYIAGVEKVWVNLPVHNAGLTRDRDHSSILEVDQLSDFISLIIKNKSPEYNSVIKDDKPVDTSNRLRISIHSPVTLGVYDATGNFTGKICPTDSEFCFAKEEIPNSSYFEFGEGKYLNVLEDNIQRVVLQGTDTGTFTYESEKVMPDNSTSIVRFIDIPVTSQTTAVVESNPVTKIQELKLDTNGDNLTDIIVQPSNTFDPVSYLQVMRKTVEGLDITKARKNGFTNRIDNTIKAIQKGKINKAKLKVDRFENILVKRIDKKDPKKPRPHQLTKEDTEQLLFMLDTLLNNLN